jgi:hypothetical protein
VSPGVPCNGVLYAANSSEFSRRLGIEQVTKLSVNSRVQFMALFEPFIYSTGAAVSGDRPGEVFAGVQEVILPGNEKKRQAIDSQYLRRTVCQPRARA